jgi:hypothetical protein
VKALSTFWWVWRWISPYLSDATRKIVIVVPDCAEMLELIEAAQLPLH